MALTAFEAMAIAGGIACIAINGALWLTVAKINKLHIDRLRRIELQHWQADS